MSFCIVNWVKRFTCHHVLHAFDLLKDSGKIKSRLAENPIDPNHRLSENHLLLVSNVDMYQQFFDRLLYLSLTRQEIDYSVAL